MGSYACDLKKGSRTERAYGVLRINERHRHRYEFANEYRAELEKNGFEIVGVNPESNLVEIVELKNHPYFIGVQFHPELKSQPLNPHPLFVGLMAAVSGKRKPALASS